MEFNTQTMKTDPHKVAVSSPVRRRALEIEMLGDRPVEVLLMDDDPAIRTLGKEALTLLGCRVVCAVDGVQAIDVHRRAAAAGQRFDVAVLDVWVPGGMGGHEALQRLLQTDPALKAIAWTGDPDGFQDSEYLRMGFRGVISKPCTMKELAEVITHVLNGLTFTAGNMEVPQ